MCVKRIRKAQVKAQVKGTHGLKANNSDVIMSAMASHNTGVSIVYPTVCLEADQRKHQNSASLAFVGGIHRWPVNSLRNGSVTRKMIPFDDVIMKKRETIGISATIAIASKRERNSDGDPIIEIFINGCTGSCYSTISSEASDEHFIKMTTFPIQCAFVQSRPRFVRATSRVLLLSI